MLYHVQQANFLKAVFRIGCSLSWSFSPLSAGYWANASLCCFTILSMLSAWFAGLIRSLITGTYQWNRSESSGDLQGWFLFLFFFGDSSSCVNFWYESDMKMIILVRCCCFQILLDTAYFDKLLRFLIMNKTISGILLKTIQANRYWALYTRAVECVNVLRPGGRRRTNMRIVWYTMYCREFKVC